jgi:hypothetical protein
MQLQIHRAGGDQLAALFDHDMMRQPAGLIVDATGLFRLSSQSRRNGVAAPTSVPTFARRFNLLHPLPADLIRHCSHPNGFTALYTFAQVGIQTALALPPSQAPATLTSCLGNLRLSVVFYGHLQPPL